MSEAHEYESRGPSLSTLVLVAVIILGLLYFLAKGCTNPSENETAPAKHSAALNATSDLSIG
ncbi:MAG: hypothetical protein ACR2KZ_15890 [Segetibacter sp.]